MKKRSFFTLASLKVFSLGNGKGIHAFLHSPRLFSPLLSVCLLGFSGQADAQSKGECFKMQSTKELKVISVEKTFSDSKGGNALKVFDGIETAFGVSVSMDIMRLSDDYLVRVLLEDAEGKKHLVAESYREIAPAEKSMKLRDYCEETALLGGVKPVCLHVIVRGAEVALHSISVSTEGTHEMKGQTIEFKKQVSDLRQKQVQAKVDIIKEFNAEAGKLWIAGITGLSMMPFEEKMSILECPESMSTLGMEYYAGGIFQFDNTNMALPNNTRSIYGPWEDIDEFDWRNWHGKNWVTPLKNQGDHDLRKRNILFIQIIGIFTPKRPSLLYICYICINFKNVLIT